MTYLLLFLFNSGSSDGGLECWICYDSDNVGPLIQPCACKVSCYRSLRSGYLLHKCSLISESYFGLFDEIRLLRVTV